MIQKEVQWSNARSDRLSSIKCILDIPLSSPSKKVMSVSCRNTMKPVTSDLLTRDQHVNNDRLLMAVVLSDTVKYTSDERPPLLKDHYFGGI